MTALEPDSGMSPQGNRRGAIQAAEAQMADSETTAPDLVAVAAIMARTRAMKLRAVATKYVLSTTHWLSWLIFLLMWQAVDGGKRHRS